MQNIPEKLTLMKLNKIASKRKQLQECCKKRGESHPISIFIACQIRKLETQVGFLSGYSLNINQLNS